MVSASVQQERDAKKRLREEATRERLALLAKAVHAAQRMSVPQAVKSVEGLLELVPSAAERVREMLRKAGKQREAALSPVKRSERVTKPLLREFGLHIAGRSRYLDNAAADIREANLSRFRSLIGRAEEERPPAAYVLNIGGSFAVKRADPQLIAELLRAALQLKRRGLFRQLKFVCLQGVCSELAGKDAVEYVVILRTLSQLIAGCMQLKEPILGINFGELSFGPNLRAEVFAAYSPPPPLRSSCTTDAPWLPPCTPFCSPLTPCQIPLLPSCLLSSPTSLLHLARV